MTDRFSLSEPHAVYVIDNLLEKPVAKMEDDESILNLLNSIADEHHTMQELYDFRMIYNALLFNNWHKHNEVEVYKSRKHNDGSIPFNDPNWFIVIANLPTGQISNHYHIRYWDYFKIPSYPQAKDQFDGHSSGDVLSRLQKILYKNEEYEFKSGD